MFVTNDAVIAFAFSWPLNGCYQVDLWLFVQRVTALVVLALLSPLFAVLWLAVRLTSKGPFLYSQLRPGLHGKPMRTWKIRTMRPGADRDQNNARCVSQSNPEVTSVGRWLRALKLDELPQLWNIVNGDMAFVGPRPIAYPLYQELCEHIPEFERRYSVLPGLSNLAQICIEENADGEAVVQDWKLRFEAEKHYLDHRSVIYDQVIICMTVIYVARKFLKLLGKRITGLVRLMLPRASNAFTRPLARKA